MCKYISQLFHFINVCKLCAYLMTYPVVIPKLYPLKKQWVVPITSILLILFLLNTLLNLIIPLSCVLFTIYIKDLGHIKR